MAEEPSYESQYDRHKGLVISSDRDQWPDLWKDVQPQWPLRLLHIPTMKSLERTGDDTYERVSRPKYCILTYTWGRFRAASGEPALPVSGTPWEIPPVKESCFSVSQFQQVINTVGQEFEYIWIDVACIDQENEATKMYEIGRQAAIFKGASRVYAWLHSLSSLDLQIIADTLYAFQDDVQSTFENRWITYKVRPIAPRGVPNVADAPAVFQKLLNDPWFTSLWTLQESVLRRDAIFLARDGSTIPYGHFLDGVRSTFYLPHLASRCSDIYDWGLSEGETDDPLINEASEVFMELRPLVVKAGMQFLYARNPNVQYGAARFRQTSFFLDRIYGIIQIYGLMLPAPEKGQVIQLEDLEEQFAEAVNARSPVLGQAFVHLGIPKEGKSWQITQVSRVPWAQVQLKQDMAYTCRLQKTPSGTACLEGPACSLQSLEEFWVRLAQLRSRPYGAAVELDYAARLPLNEHAPGEDWDGWIDYAFYPELHYYPCKALISVFQPDQLRVVLLGRHSHIGEADPEHEDRTFEGLIVYRGFHDDQWRRIGVCHWEETHFTGLEPFACPQPGWVTSSFELH